MAVRDDDLLDEYPPGYDGRISPVEFYACPIGVALWEQYRAEHPNAPVEPTPSEEQEPDAAAYWTHIGGCRDCNED